MARLTAAQRDRFDRLLEAELDALPPQVRQWLDEVPVIVEDEPGDQLLDELGFTEEDQDADPDASDDLLGLHTGIPLTERSVEDRPDVPDHIMLFRRPIYDAAGGIGRPDMRELRRQIHITLLHEIGHHFGLDEDDLARLGYD